MHYDDVKPDSGSDTEENDVSDSDTEANDDDTEDRNRPSNESWVLTDQKDE